MTLRQIMIEALTASIGDHETGEELADDVLEAIEAAGTHCIVPVEPTEEMTRSMAFQRENRKPVADIWKAALAARPRDVAPTEQSDG